MWFPQTGSALGILTFLVNNLFRDSVGQQDLCLIFGKVLQHWVPKTPKINEKIRKIHPKNDLKSLFWATFCVQKAFGRL